MDELQIAGEIFAVAINTIKDNPKFGYLRFASLNVGIRFGAYEPEAVTVHLYCGTGKDRFAHHIELELSNMTSRYSSGIVEEIVVQRCEKMLDQMWEKLAGWDSPTK